MVMTLLDNETMKNFAEFNHSNMEDYGHEVHHLRHFLQRTDNSGKVTTLLDLIRCVVRTIAQVRQVWRTMLVASVESNGI